MFDDHTVIASEARYKSISEEGIKTLTSKPMLQRLLIAFAQVKTWNTLQNITIKIRHIVYLRGREKTKNIDNNIKIQYNYNIK